RVAIDGISVHDAAAAFGLSHQTFYRAKADFEQSGLAGLVPVKRGPKGGHKITTEGPDFIPEAPENDATLRIPELTRRVKERFGIQIHQQSIQRALGRFAKELQAFGSTRPTTFVSDHLEIDFVTRKVQAGKKKVHLTPTEFDILRHL